GRGLRLSDLDPWLSRVGPTRSTAGGQTLQPPEGIDELVGVDWTNSLIGR
ncbi:MAG: hypothetical protein HUU35_15415, partial [Armatimonadetes bacterium]|nr:hypothetical protein [Armatimonadota bacterium]